MPTIKGGVKIGKDGLSENLQTSLKESGINCSFDVTQLKPEKVPAWFRPLKDGKKMKWDGKGWVEDRKKIMGIF
jgi:hypothetical protein